jgi:hypothetical protein
MREHYLQFLYVLLLLQSQDSSVDVVTGYGLDSWD